ncbi:MAG: hypothetical protein V4666_01145 [Bacteroidota bacterium]
MKNYIKSLAIIIAFSIILSSCSVYYKKEATFNEAYLSEKPVKLVTKQNKKVFLRRIILKDTTYYGIYNSNGKKIAFPLSEDSYRSLRIKNRPASTMLNITGAILTLGVVGVIIFVITFDLDFEDNWKWEDSNNK